MNPDQRLPSFPPPEPPSEEARAALGARLDQAFAESAGSVHRGWRLPRFAIPVAGLVGLGLALQAPAEYPLQLGKRISVTLPRDAELRITDSALGQSLHGLGELQAEIHRSAHHTPEGDAFTTSLELSLWGRNLPSDPQLADLVSKAIPGLAADQITVTALEGHIHGRLGGWLRDFVIPDSSASAEEIERARQELIARIHAREGADANVNVEIQPGEDGNRVKVQVEKQRTVATNGN